MKNLSKFIARRNFLRKLTATAAGAALAPYLRPSAAFAEVDPIGTRKVQILIKIFLSGGPDGLFFFPPKETTRFNALKTQRPTLMGSSTLSQPGHVLDIGSSFGVHPWFGALPAMQADSLRSIHQMITDGHGKIIPKLGYPTPDLNHQTAADRMNIGAVDFNPGSALHWEARAMQEYELEWNQIWLVGLASGQIPFRAPAGSTPPINARFLSQVQKFSAPHYQTGWQRGRELGGQPEISAAQRAIEEILELTDENDISTPKREYKNAMRNALETTNLIGSINSTALPSYFSRILDGNNYPHGIADNIKDIARVIGHYHSSPSTRDKTLIFHFGYFGFDTHENQAAGLERLMKGINHSVAALRQYLVGLSLWDKTAIQFIGDFGRDVVENPSLGTSHGHGLLSLVLGGSLDPSTGVVAGGESLLPGLAELQSPSSVGESRVLSASVDPRDLVWELLGGLGHDPGRVLSYSPSVNLRLFG